MFHKNCVRFAQVDVRREELAGLGRNGQAAAEGVEVGDRARPLAHGRGHARGQGVVDRLSHRGGQKTPPAADPTAASADRNISI